MRNNMFKDRMVNSDALQSERDISRGSIVSAPQGKLFEVVGCERGKRVLKEIACNTVVVGGAVSSLENLTGVSANWKPATLNDIHGIPATGVGNPKICLFGAGTGGAGLDFGSVISPNIKQRDILEPIPIRYCANITGDDASKYFLKKLNGGGTTSSWFLKEFDSAPVIKSCWKNAASDDEDGTEIITEIFDSPNTEGIETFTEFNISLNTKDFREYFEAVGQVSSARYNTFGFYTASKDAAGTEYGNVRLYSVITFNNRDLSIPSSSTFVYRVYSLI